MDGVKLEPDEVKACPSINLQTHIGDVSTLCNDVTPTDNDVPASCNDVRTRNDDVSTSCNAVTALVDNVPQLCNDVTPPDNDVPASCSDVRTRNDDVSTSYNAVTTLVDNVPQLCNDVTPPDNGVPASCNDVRTHNDDVSTSCNAVTTLVDNVPQLCNDVTPPENDVPASCNDVRTRNDDVSTSCNAVTTQIYDVNTSCKDITTHKDDAPISDNEDRASAIDEECEVDTDSCASFDSDHSDFDYYDLMMYSSLFRRESPVIDDMLRNVSDLIDEDELEKAKTLTLEMYERLGTLHKSHEAIDYVWYYYRCCNICRDMLNPALAIKAFYKGVLHSVNVTLMLDHDTAWLWLELFESDVSIEEISKIAWEIKIWTDLKLHQADGEDFNILVHIYSHLMLTFSSILVENQQCPGAKAWKLSTMLQFSKCLISVGNAFEVPGICKTGLREYPDNVALLEVWAMALQKMGQLELALGKTESALLYVKDEIEKTSLENLQSTLREQILLETPVDPKKSAPADVSWLEGTNVGEPLRNSKRVEEIKQNHVKHVRRRPKPIKRTISTHNEFKSWSERMEANVSNTATPPSLVGHLNKGRRKTKARRKNLQSVKPDTKSMPAAAVSCESETQANAEQEDVSSDDEECEVADHMSSEIFDTSLLYTENGHSMDIADVESYFEESSRDIELHEGAEEREQAMLLHGVRLSTQYVRACAVKVKHNTYDDQQDIDDPQALLMSNPGRYKRCSLHIESAHRSVCVLSNPEDDIKEIEISGRSKCGKHFSEDEVVVEILNPEDKTRKMKKDSKLCQDRKTYGKVVGCLQRKRFCNIDHPVLICELDGTKYHLMRPLDKTVPKISILKNHVKNNFQVEVYEYSNDTGELKFSGEIVNINPAQKQSYIFHVAYIRWDAIYPLGAVIKIIRTDGGINSSLRILDLMYQVPTMYRKDTVTSVQSIMCEMREKPVAAQTGYREDLTDSLSVFTIDPPNSTDLDDAVSVRKMPNDITEVGVHISDVTDYVRKGDHIDDEAKYRGTTFYPGQGRHPHHMFPEPLSQDICSLLPNKSRHSLSIFFNFKANGDLITESPIIKKTCVKSRRRFTYREVQTILFDRTTDGEFSADLKCLYAITQLLRKRRLNEAKYRQPVEVPIEDADVDTILDAPEAHALVEELMVLSNKTVAKYICSQFHDSALLRCQDAPSSVKVQEWLKQYPNIADIIVGLQNVKVLPQRQLKITDAPKAGKKTFIELHKSTWESLDRYVKESDFEKAWELIGSDELHPEQALAWHEWKQLQEPAAYRCLGSVKNRKERFHFALNETHYTHFTSPIRRYADVVIHRLVHAALENQPAPYTKTEIDEICTHLNEVSRRAKMYERQCKILQYGYALKRAPVLTNGFVEDSNDQHITLCIPGLDFLPKQSRQVSLNLLNVSDKPITLKDVDNDRPFNIMSFCWQLRLYSDTGYAPISKRHEKVRIDPHQQVIFQQYSRWVALLKTLISRNGQQLRDILSVYANYEEGEHLRELVPACTSTLKDVSSEVSQGVITKHICEFSMSFSHSQILSVQLCAEPQKGCLLPYPQLVELTNNVKLCLEHPCDPVKYLAWYATRPAHMHNYQSVAEYIEEVWMPIERMEAATRAVREDSIIVNDIAVRLKERHGTFTMRTDFCEDRQITFQSMSVDTVLNGDEANEQDDDIKYVPTSDFLCIKYPYTVHERSNASPTGSPRTRIWLAHGRIDQVKRSREDNTIKVHFVLHPLGPKPPAQLLNSGTHSTCSIEILATSESNRTEATLRCLNKAGKVAQAIALGKKIPALDKDHLELAKRIELDVNICGLPKNNRKQHTAIQMALTRTFTLIQGPPGTGKTYTGIKLLYLFTKLNRIWHQEGNNLKQVVLCGPSNKAVDLVAKWTLRKLGEHAPRLVRMYRSAHECIDYPIPGKLFSRRSSKFSYGTDKELQDIALHHLIRKNGKPYAESIRHFDKLFRQYQASGDSEDSSTLKQQIREFHALRSKAEQEELKNCDVILCTTAMTTNPKFIRATRDRIFQCIIDESGMCTEPESLATIIATKAEQVILIGDHKQLRPVVMCQHAASMGLQKSLFERYSEKAIFLSTQYRMNPRICDFVSAQFYHNQLETATSFAWKEPNPLSLWKYSDVPHIFCHVEGEEEYLAVSTQEGNEQSCSNKAEVDKVLAVFKYMVTTDGVEPRSINIISQYNAQCHAIKEALLKSGYINCHVNTVVASQGGEWDYVIFSTARSLPDYKIEPYPTLGWCTQNLGFITDDHQIDVALSRARKGLVIIGNKNLLKCDKVWKQLLEHYGKSGCVVDAKEFPPHNRKRSKRKRAAQPSRQTSKEFYNGTDMD